MKTIAEYIWLDGYKPTPNLRSKTRILKNHVYKLDDIPNWGFDGSSTKQAITQSSDCILKPVHYIYDPVRKDNAILVLCEVYNADNTPHKSNMRQYLHLAEEKYKQEQAIFTFEQEYTLLGKDGWPYNWPENAYPEPQGKYYCAVGADRVWGRQFVETHTQACLEANILLSGINAEVMPSQWEYQIGPLPSIQVADEMWLSRWLLHRIGEDFGITVSLHPKPMDGDWNGAGCHANFSTLAMRENNGLEIIKQACEKLGQYHEQHIKEYGADNEKRLTGLHETCGINMYKYGIADRGASVRIPLHVSQKGKGYLEDRRPSANMDPYRVCTAILETVCGDGFTRIE